MNLSLYYETLKYIKPRQWYYQVIYRLRNKLIKFKRPIATPEGANVNLQAFIPAYPTYKGNNSFEFLNRFHSFSDIDWNFSDYGKLWTYNLNYFEFLNQQGIQKDEGVRLMMDFCEKQATHKDGDEPYPVSLRIINWVKFLSRHNLSDESKIREQLYADCIRLSRSIEYHLLANHLLENGFGLLFGAYYFRNDKLYRKAYKIITGELKEQILPDGAHYELSPMYHQIILSRVLDAYNLVTHNEWHKGRLDILLQTKAALMVSWIQAMTFSSGAIPMVNDAAPDIAVDTRVLRDYAAALSILSSQHSLRESGYRKFSDKSFELLFDAGQIAPSYQPGHSHADNLNFLLNFNGNPIVVDTGVSTYEKNARRLSERATHSHNTISVNGINSSEVWSGFRVGRRAKTTINKEGNCFIEAFHDGYKKWGIIHRRSVRLEDSFVSIQDTIEGDIAASVIEGFIHFHPSVSVESDGEAWVINNQLLFTFHGRGEVNLESCLFAEGFNKLVKTQRLKYRLKDKNFSFSVHPKK